MFGQKSVFTWNCKFLQTLINTGKTREPIINVRMIFHRYSVFFYGQSGVILNILICDFYFSNNFNTVFHEKDSRNLLVL